MSVIGNGKGRGSETHAYLRDPEIREAWQKHGVLKPRFGE